MSWLFPSSAVRRRLGAALAVVAATVGAASAGAVAPASASPPGFRQVNLVSDVPGLARLTDVRVSNPWGIAIGPTTAVWINNNNTATSEAYSGANGVDPLTLRIAVQTPAGPTASPSTPRGRSPPARAAPRSPPSSSSTGSTGTRAVGDRRPSP